MTIKNTVRRLVAGAGAMALATLGVMALGTAASADGDAPDLGNINPDATGTITIHKRVGTPGAAGNGTELTNPPGIPLGGVPFMVQRVGVGKTVDGTLTCVPIDLSTAADWDAIKGAPPQTPEGSSSPAAPTTPLTEGELCNYGTAISLTTANGTGTATTPALALGLYYVTEQPSTGVTALAAPFYVTVPFSSAGTGGAKTWLYNVHVYPKNSIAGDPSKTLDSVTGAVVGENGAVAHWTLTSPVLGSTRLPGSSTALSVYDNLGQCLAYKADSGLLTIKVPGVTPDATQSIVPTIDANNKATFSHTFPQAGYPAGTTFVITYDTTVKCVGGNDGATWNDSEWGKDVSWWGELEVTKKDSTNGKLLKDAEFALYAGVCPATEAGLGTALLTGKTDGTGTWTTAGLYVGMHDPATPSSASYCLVETKAPNGYVTPTYANGHWTLSIQPGKVATVEVEEGDPIVTGNYKLVNNTPVDVPEIPLTGADGTMMLTLGGLALIGVAGGGFLVHRSRKQS